LKQTITRKKMSQYCHANQHVTANHSVIAKSKGLKPCCERSEANPYEVIVSSSIPRNDRIAALRSRLPLASRCSLPDFQRNYHGNKDASWWVFNKDKVVLMEASG